MNPYCSNDAKQFALSLSKGRSWFDKPVLSAIFSFDKLRMNGVEGLTTNGYL